MYTGRLRSEIPPSLVGKLGRMSDLSVVTFRVASNAVNNNSMYITEKFNLSSKTPEWN